jgi:ribosomal-protein-alanine N-acetyltransferase
MHVRPAIPADIPVLMALERCAVTAAHWSAEQYQAVFSNIASSRLALVIGHESRLEGFLIARAVEHEWEIENLAVAGSARRQGYGTQLLGRFLDMARSHSADAVFLEVRESNSVARRFYEKRAFVESGVRRKYYREPVEDAVTYRFAFS